MTFFSANDFGSNEWGAISAWQAANIANQKLQREAKVVYGIQNAAVSDMYFSLSKDDEDTHRALLICVEEIEKPECKHEVRVHLGLSHDAEDHWGECKKCGVKLKATWSVADEQR